MPALWREGCWAHHGLLHQPSPFFSHPCPHQLGAVGCRRQKLNWVYAPMGPPLAQMSSSWAWLHGHHGLCWSLPWFTHAGLCILVALAVTGVSLPVGPGKFPEWSLMKWAGPDGCFKPVMVARGYNLTLGGQESGSSPEPGGGMGEWFPQTKSRCS